MAAVLSFSFLEAHLSRPSPARWQSPFQLLSPALETGEKAAWVSARPAWALKAETHPPQQLSVGSDKGGSSSWPSHLRLPQGHQNDPRLLLFPAKAKSRPDKWTSHSPLQGPAAPGSLGPQRCPVVAAGTEGCVPLPFLWPLRLEPCSALSRRLPCKCSACTFAHITSA